MYLKIFSCSRDYHACSLYGIIKSVNENLQISICVKTGCQTISHIRIRKKVQRNVKARQTSMTKVETWLFSKATDYTNIASNISESSWLSYQHFFPSPKSLWKSFLPSNFLFTFHLIGVQCSQPMSRWNAVTQNWEI